MDIQDFQNLLQNIETQALFPMFDIKDECFADAGKLGKLLQARTRYLTVKANK